MPQIPQKLPYKERFRRTNQGKLRRGSDQRLKNTRAAATRNLIVARRCHQNSITMGNRRTGATFTWQLIAKNSPHRDGRLRIAAQTEATRKNTITGSVFPWNPETMIETGLTAKTRMAQRAPLSRASVFAKLSRSRTTPKSARIPGSLRRKGKVIPLERKNSM